MIAKFFFFYQLYNVNVCDLFLGEWWNDDTQAVITEAVQNGGNPNVSDAFTINGLPGPFYNCSSHGMELYNLLYIIFISLKLHIYDLNLVLISSLWILKVSIWFIWFYFAESYPEIMKLIYIMVYEKKIYIYLNKEGILYSIWLIY